MALTRGEKKVSMPISAEAARLGTQQNKSNIFGALIGPFSGVSIAISRAS